MFRVWVFINNSSIDDEDDDDDDDDDHDDHDELSKI